MVKYVTSRGWQPTQTNFQMAYDALKGNILKKKPGILGNIGNFVSGMWSGSSWKAKLWYSVSDIIYTNADKSYDKKEHKYMVYHAGYTGDFEPLWGAETQKDGTVEWRRIDSLNEQLQNSIEQMQQLQNGLGLQDGLPGLGGIGGIAGGLGSAGIVDPMGLPGWSSGVINVPNWNGNAYTKPSPVPNTPKPEPSKVEVQETPKGRKFRNVI